MESMAGSSDLQHKIRQWENVSKETDAQDKSPSSVCDLCNKEANVVCFDCTKFYCSECNNKLGATKTFANHVHSIVQKDGFRQLVCSGHDKIVQAFCLSCKLAVCQRCLIGEHATHEIRPFAIASRIQVDTTEDVPKALARMEELMGEVDPLLAVQKAHVAALKDNIRKYKLQMIKEIDEQEAELYSTIEKKQAQFEEDLMLKKNAISGNRSKLDILKQKKETCSKPLPAAPDVSLAQKEIMEVQIENDMNEIALTEYQLPVSPEYWFLEGPARTQLGILTNRRQSAPLLPERKRISSDGQSSSSE